MSYCLFLNDKYQMQKKNCITFAKNNRANNWQTQYFNKPDLND